MTASDPFEEFEFRPLTEGLGFHRQPEKKSSASAPASFELKQTLPEIEMPVGARPQTPTAPTTALRRPIADAPAANPDAGGTVDEILKTLQSKRKHEFVGNKVSTAPAAVVYRAAGPDLSSFILDGMLVMAASLACLIILLMVTRVDLFSALTQNSDTETYGALALLFTGVAWIYLVLNRVYLGCTPGEWVFDHRIGRPEDQGTASYSLRIVARATLAVFTGMIPFPLVSMLFRKDLLGLITGAPLMRKL